MAAPEILFQPVDELASQIRTRQLSPVELVRACLHQIEALNPKVLAFITVAGDRALERARQAEREIAAGHYRGPLHGIPYAPKDLFATKGLRTTNGSKVTANWVPDHESTVTARLNDAGAILLGKLNLLEFAMGSGQRGLVGPARNPWDLAYSPSGSSSGSGAALAAGMTPLTLGSDTGGSIRNPAKSCGVVGLKPTYGRVSRFGVTTLSWTLDHAGPMARTVGGVARLLQVIAGADPLDPNAAAHPVPDYQQSLNKSIRGLRIGFPTEHFFDHVAPETDAALREAMGLLEQMGAVRVGYMVANASQCGTVSSLILDSEASAFHRKSLREHAELFDPLVRERLETGTFNSAVDYIQALRMRTLFIEEMRRIFRSCDAILLPAGNAAPKLEEETVGSDAATIPPAAPRPDSYNLANVTGIPAIVLPCGFTTGPPVLPLGIQFCARPFDEATLFRIASAYEAATEWHKRRPSLAAML